MKFDGKKPIEFNDETTKLEEEQGIEETKYKLKVDDPTPETDVDIDMGGGEDTAELEGLDDGGDKPFDDEPFDAGVEADEETDPKNYIQQLAGKLGQSLRKYTNDTGQPDLELEKFAINSVISATHTSKMDDEDQNDIIKKIKTSGEGEEGGEDVDIDIDSEKGVDIETPDSTNEPEEDEELNFGENYIGEHHDTDYKNYGKYDDGEYMLDVDDSEPSTKKEKPKTKKFDTINKVPRRKKPWKVTVSKPSKEKTGE